MATELPKATKTAIIVMPVRVFNPTSFGSSVAESQPLHEKAASCEITGPSQNGHLMLSCHYRSEPEATQPKHEQLSIIPADAPG